MQILLAPHSGFCFGVKRALQIALEAVAKHKTVYTYGHLIHNPQIVSELEAQGIEAISDDVIPKDSIVIIRSHGITKQRFEELEDNGNTIIDATCPYVTRTHAIISRLTEEKYPVIVFGDIKHPEVIGMVSYGKDNVQVVNSADDLPASKWQQVSIISQTTQRLESFQKVVDKILPNALELRVFNTICLATTVRQNASLELAKHSDLMIVIGGKNSSNTRVLAQICQQITKTIHIETEAELLPATILDCKRIGLTAGASTPDSTIIKVYNKIKEILGETDAVISVEQIPTVKEESC